MQHHKVMVNYFALIRPVQCIVSLGGMTCDFSGSGSGIGLWMLSWATSSFWFSLNFRGQHLDLLLSYLRPHRVCPWPAAPFSGSLSPPPATVGSPWSRVHDSLGPECPSQILSCGRGFPASWHLGRVACIMPHVASSCRDLTPLAFSLLCCFCPTLYQKGKCLLDSDFAVFFRLLCSTQEELDIC